MSATGFLHLLLVAGLMEGHPYRHSSVVSPFRTSVLLFGGTGLIIGVLQRQFLNMNAHIDGLVTNGMTHSIW